MTTIEYNEKQTINELMRVINHAEGTPINELRIIDLAECGSGIYIFYQQQANKRWYFYIGKASSESLVQRIAIHFDTRIEMASSGILSKVQRSEAIADQSAFSLIDAIRLLEKKNTRLIFITISPLQECKRVVTKLEYFLINAYDTPKVYNVRRGKAAPSLDIPLKELIPN